MKNLIANSLIRKDKKEIRPGDPFQEEDEKAEELLTKGFAVLSKDQDKAKAKGTK